MAWNERNPTYEEERRYLNLVDLHGLTQTWLKELLPQNESPGKELHRLERIRRPELIQNLWLVEKLKIDQLPPELSTVIDGSSVQQFLNELEETIWIIQLSVLENTLEHAHDKAAVLNLMERLSWGYAKKLSERDWPHFVSEVPLDCFEAFRSGLRLQKDGVLLESYHSKLCSFYWLASPLSRDSLTRSVAIEEFCNLHFHFIRGYFFGLSRAIRVEFLPASLVKRQTIKINLQPNSSRT